MWLLQTDYPALTLTADAVVHTHQTLLVWACLAVCFSFRLPLKSGMDGYIGLMRERGEEGTLRDAHLRGGENVVATKTRQEVQRMEEEEEDRDMAVLFLERERKQSGTSRRSSFFIPRDFLY